MDYEKLFGIAGSRFEAVEEAMQMLAPADLGRKDYNSTVRAYGRFCKDGNLVDFEFVAEKLSRIVGYKI